MKENTQNSPPRTLSALLDELAGRFSGPDAPESITIDDICEAFHERGFGFLLFIISFPAALPLPAMGLNLIMAAPLIMLSAQQALGFHQVWIPEFMRKKTVSRDTFLRFIAMARPWITRTERLIRPRLGFITQGAFSNIIGVCGLIMSLVAAIPLPFTNTVPSLGITVMAAGVLMRDGLAVIIGALIGLCWIAVLCAFVMFFGMAGIDMMKNALLSFL